eukprot:scaffold4387_cov126-Isochrysis_galbana.AAC.3
MLDAVGLPQHAQATRRRCTAEVRNDHDAACSTPRSSSEARLLLSRRFTRQRSALGAWRWTVRQQLGSNMLTARQLWLELLRGTATMEPLPLEKQHACARPHMQHTTRHTRATRSFHIRSMQHGCQPAENYRDTVTGVADTPACEASP